MMPAGLITLTPSAGYVYSDMAGLPLGHSYSTKGLSGFTAGLEAEYQGSRVFSMSVGMMYAQQGARISATRRGPDGLIQHADVWERIDYLNVLAMANAYIFKDFALKAGVQPGIRLNKSTLAQDIGFCIPVGVSYAYKGIEIEARYAIGAKIFSLPVDSRNNVSSLTLGYRINLGVHKLSDKPSEYDVSNWDL